MATRVLRLVIASFLLAIVTLLPFGCGLSTSGIPNDSSCKSCSEAAQCVTGNPCVTATCNEKSCCDLTPVPDGDAPVQKPGDCLVDTCVSGALVQKDDVHDIADDNEPCTIDTCGSDGEEFHTAVGDDTPCNIGDAPGTCSFGKCVVKCSETEPCKPDGNPCTEDVCDVGIGECDYQPLHGVPVPGVAPVAGDCRDRLCVNGKDENVVDDDDLPVDGFECTLDLCNSGTPGNPSLDVDTACGPSGIDFCDGGNGCGECNVAAQCFPSDPPDSFCSVRTCIGHVCGKALKPDGTLVPVQTDFDCNNKVCNGVGGEKNVANDLDLPEDNNPCTTDTCTNGTKQNVPKVAGTSCGAPLVCDGTGQCVGCNVAGDCPGMDDFCKTRTCSANICGYSFTPDGTAFPAAQQTSGDCLQRQCDGAGNEKQAALNSDLPLDGNSCTNDVCTMGSPSNPPKAMNTPCTGPLAPAGGFCDGMTTCYACNAPDQCPTPPTCMTNTCNAHVCGQVPTPANTPIASQTPKDCKIVVCDGSGGTVVNTDTGDLPDDNNLCTVDSCNGSTPVNTPVAPGTSCGSNLVCDDMGFCGKAPGQPCATAAECGSHFCVDGVCCNNACSGTCQGCTLALTNMASGTCANVKSGTEDSLPACNGPNACDGMGNCKFDNGQPCSTGGQCVSGSCADGVCCNSMCGNVCQACTNVLTGAANGSCANITAGLEDTMPACNGPSSCDGSGNCKKDNGQTCSVPGECSSGFCADGFCCNLGCTGVCRACSAILTGGTNGTCANILPQNDDTTAPNTCTGTTTCDGAGVCKNKNGQPCGTGCASGFCVDTVCCATACSGVCVACSAAKKGGGTNGTCGNVAAGTDPDSECAPDAVSTCGNDGTCGAGACRKYVAGTVCAASSCAGVTQQNADTCDGSGTCVDNGTTSCLPLICGPTACLMTCTVDTDCSSSSQYCAAGTCTDKKMAGGPCASPNQCVSGLFCVDGTCCTSDCPACQVCNTSGNGTCSNALQGVDDNSAPNTCNGNMTCNGSGDCLLKSGQPCVMGSDCASGNCGGNPKQCQ